jgi:hypothetical protein
MKGFYDPDIHVNHNQSLINFMKIPLTDDGNNSGIDTHLYDVFFKETVDRLRKTTGVVADKVGKNEKNTGKSGKKQEKQKPIKKADAIRIENMTANIELNREHIFEFTLLQLVEPLCTAQPTLSTAQSLYTLLQLRKASIAHVNRYVCAFVDACIERAKKTVNLMDIVVHAEAFIEKNRLLGKYADLTLFSHQKDLFRLFNQSYVPPTLTLYIAPTGTGKTLSPLGLAQNGRVVIFVCSARHVGLSLARSAVSMQKRVAFAYGCASAEDIRLHNYAAVDYVINRKSGAIAKVDNSNGSRVEIMICDVKSYLVAMQFLLEFHLEESIVMYWDEPTIAMDYEDHPLHNTIHRVWAENRISRIVLSCATMPKEAEITRTLDDYLLRFSKESYNNDGKAKINSIVSFDFKKSISVIGQAGYSVLPHLLFAKFRDLLESVQHFKDNKTLLRYLDLAEVSRFIQTVATGDQVTQHFCNDMSTVNMTSIKLYYLELLEQVEEETWPGLYTYFTQIQQPKFSRNPEPKKRSDEIHKIKSMVVLPSNTASKTSSESIPNIITGGGELRRCSSVVEVPASTPISVSEIGRPISVSKSFPRGIYPIPRGIDPIPRGTDPFSGIQFTTGDAWTLTDGPTIYIAENVENIGLFYIKQTALPKFETDEIMRKIGVNSALQKKIEALEHDIEDKKGKDADKDKKVERDAFSREVKEMDKQLTMLREQIESVRMRMDYVPNTPDHLEKHSVKFGNKSGNPFATGATSFATAQGLGPSVLGATSFATGATPFATGAQATPFAPTIGESDIVRIMELDIENYKKVLLLLGIGVFTLSAKSAYLELMKEFATEQKLYMILASSDYIYGTNYAFCHGVVSKDLTGMTQQKTIQAMGRIGRNVVQQDYTVRFRNDTIIRNLFLPPQGGNLEATNMCRLFSSSSD